VLPDDTVVVATEGRHEVCDAGPRDLLVRRSTDGGATWTPTQTVVASVDGASWGNPAFVVDRTTGELFLFYNLGERLPDNTGCSADSAEMFVVSSTDAGVTWGPPRGLSHLFTHFDYDWTLDSPGPGHGIQLDSGRLLLNVAHRRVIVDEIEPLLRGLRTNLDTFTMAARLRARVLAVPSRSTTDQARRSRRHTSGNPSSFLVSQPSRAAGRSSSTTSMRVRISTT
jgi:hypothetical protein